MNIQDHDCVVLTADLPAEGLEAGDVGTVVHILLPVTIIARDFFMIISGDEG